MKTISLMRRASDFSAENLAHILPGCYVKIQKGSHDFWVEITNIEESQFKALVKHVEGGEFDATTELKQGDAIIFEKNEILETGCDRWCWC